VKSIISTNKAPAAIGPYSQAVRLGNLVFTSGQIPADPASGEIVPGGVEIQTRQALKNLEEVLNAAGTKLKNVLKTTLFIKNMDDFLLINEVYAKFFSTEPPARSCVEAARLPKDVLIEIEAVAYIP
jgi:2-iminobutanoate/2-iminopropanoate deaminase